MNKKSKINKVMLSISTMALSLGAIQTHASAEEKVPYNVLHSKPVGIEKPVDEIGHVSKAEETLSFQERLKVGDFSQRPASIPNKAAVKQVKESYSMADLNKMNDQELVETLGSIKWHQITDLFQFNEDAKSFYKDKGKMQVVIDELAHRGSTFTKDDSKGIQTFTEVLRSAFIWHFIITN